MNRIYRLCDLQRLLYKTIATQSHSAK